MKATDVSILRAIIEAAGSCVDSLNQITRWEKLLEAGPGRCNLLLECTTKEVTGPEPLYHLNEPHKLPNVAELDFDTKEDLRALLKTRRIRIEKHLAAMKVRFGPLC
jgi:hypothetical protein